MAGETHEYINAPTAAGAKAFPVGTIFVKTVESKKKSDIFAMVKRGKGFNASGASGWEWFGLRARRGRLGGHRLAWSQCSRRRELRR